MRIVSVVSFLNEERYLERFLASIERQSRPPDELLLVDDGSTDRSLQIATDFADRRQTVRVLSRPRRPPGRDRLAEGSVVRAFEWGLSQASASWDVAVKMDADLVLSQDLFASVERAFLEQPNLGIAGTHLSVVEPRTGQSRRERCPSHHVRGATKFYRRACYEQISPLPTMLGWDTIDEITARRRGWRTGNIDCPGGDTIQLRPTGAHDGRVRAQFRWGTCAYAIGQHPLWVMASTARRLSDSPAVLGAVAFMAGWLTGPVRRRPRAPAEVRAFGSSEQLRSLRRIWRAVPGGPGTVRRAIAAMQADGAG